MDSAKLNDWMQVVGIFALVASIIFVGMQMRQDRQLAEAQQYIDKAASHVEMSQLMTDNQSVWVMGLDGEELSLEDQAKFDQIARSWQVRKLNNYYASLRVGTVESEAIVRSFAVDLYKHSGLRRWFLRFRADSDLRKTEAGRQTDESTFSGQVERALAELDKEAPENPEDKTYLLP